MTSWRIALYWAPEEHDPLHGRASAWLGRDAISGAMLPQASLPGHDIAEITADARGYGLHATLKPPFRLAGDLNAALAAAEECAAKLAPFTLPPLAVMDLDGFLALRETTACPALQNLADACVAALDPHRAPATEAEIARRKPERLSPRQRDYLTRWGYPYVFDEWRFHMTLTRRLNAPEKASIMPAAITALGDTPAQPRQVRDIAVFAQASAGAPFTVLARLPLRG